MYISVNGKHSDLITEYTFHSSAARIPSPPTFFIDEQASYVECNNIFPIYLYIPTGFYQADVRHVVVIINGFNEPDKRFARLYYPEIDGISLCEAIHSRNDNATRYKHSFAKVLMPIPFHYWRQPKHMPCHYRTFADEAGVDCYACRTAAIFKEPAVRRKKLENQSIIDYYDIEEMVRYQPFRLYLGYHQLMMDISDLINLIKTGTSRNNLNKKIDCLPRDCQIHILGYSLGGLGALAYFLYNSMYDKGLVSSCHMLASGTTIKRGTTFNHEYAPEVGRDKRHEYSQLGEQLLFSRLLSNDTMLVLRGYFDSVKPSTSMLSVARDRNLVIEVLNEHKDLISVENPGELLSIFDRIVNGLRNVEEYGCIDEAWLARMSKIWQYFCSEDEISREEAITVSLPDGSQQLVKEQFFTINGAGHFLAFDPVWRAKALDIGNEISKRMIICSEVEGENCVSLRKELKYEL